MVSPVAFHGLALSEIASHIYTFDISDQQKAVIDKSMFQNIFIGGMLLQ